MSTEMNKYIKLGERILPDANLKMVLPNWEEIINQIDEIREAAGSFAQERKRKSDSMQTDYNNVISILGERGSGKSSVLLTILQKLKEKNHNACPSKRDVFLSLIVPELLEPSSDILGVILLNFKSYIDENKEIITSFYKKERSTRDDRSRDSFNSCLFNEKTKLDVLWDKVFSLYIYRKKGANKVIEENFSGVSHYTEEKKEALVSEIELRERLKEFYDELIRALNGSDEGKHLIYVIFDDIDINPMRCNEVLNVVLKYLNYPNIVTFVSGDITKINEDLVSELLIQQRGDLFLKEYLVEQRTMLESQQDLVYDFLKKIMPYSRRFSLDKLSAQSKMNFTFLDYNSTLDTYEKTENSRDNNIELTGLNGILMQDLIGKQIESAQKPFIINLDSNSDSKIVIPHYFDIFDNKPRGLLNIYSYLNSSKDINSNNCKNISYYEKLFEMIIETNNELRKHHSFIKGLYFITIGEISESLLISINHDKLRLQMESSSLKLNRKEKILIIHFLYFVESLIRKNVTMISGREYSLDFNIALGISGDQRVIPIASDVRYVFAMYSMLHKIFEVEQMKDIYNKRIYLSKYKEIVEREFKDYENIFTEDIIWIDEIKRLTNNNEQHILEIKERLFEDFKEFPIDTYFISKLDIYASKEYINSLEYNTSIQDIEMYKKYFEELSLYIYFKRAHSDEENEEPTVNLDIDDIDIKVDDIIQKRQFFMNNEKIKAIINMSSDLNNRTVNFQIDLLIEKLKLISIYLESQISFYINTRSIHNEKILLNRIKDEKLVIYNVINAAGIEKYNYVIPKSIRPKKDTLPELLFEQEELMRSNEFVDLIEFIYDIDRNIVKYLPGMQFLEELHSSTRTKSKNAFIQFTRIIMYYELLNQISDLIMQVEESRLGQLLIELEQSMEKEEIEFLNDDERNEKLIYYYSMINNILKDEVNLFNTLEQFNRKKNELSGEYEKYQEQYHISNINVKYLNRFMSKIDNESIINELKKIQRRLLETNSVSKELFDNVINKINEFLIQIKDKDHYIVMELKSLVNDFYIPIDQSNIRKEIERVRKEAKERLFHMELEILIHAMFLKYYNILSHNEEIYYD